MGQFPVREHVPIDCHRHRRKLTRRGFSNLALKPIETLHAHRCCARGARGPSLLGMLQRQMRTYWKRATLFDLMEVLPHGP